jgi:transposase-like protein
VEEAYLTFDCPSCGHAITPEPLEGERGNQSAVCPSCKAAFTRTFAFHANEWVFGLWRSVETGKVACTYYKTVFGASDVDC